MVIVSNLICNLTCQSVHVVKCHEWLRKKNRKNPSNPHILLDYDLAADNTPDSNANEIVFIINSVENVPPA